MQELPPSFEVSCRRKSEACWSPAELMGALETAATDHADALNIGHDRMVKDFGCLWMLVRSRLELQRLPAPQEELTVRTWLRKPTPVTSIRDYAFCADGSVIGRALHYWVLVDVQTRKIVNLRNISVLWELPAMQPERTETMRRLTIPSGLADVQQCRIMPSEIDDNGHMNNVAYVRHAQQFAPDGCTGLEIIYDHECFLGEELRLETVREADAVFVRGEKENGTESFRMRFYRAAQQEESK